MKNFIKVFLFVFMSMFACLTFAQSVGTVADVKTNLISSMEKDGYLSKKMADEVSQKYISEEDKTKSINVLSPKEVAKQSVSTEKASVSWTDYLSWINFFKVVGVIFFLVAFSGIISKIVVGAWFLIAAVPVIIYQLVFLTGALFGIFRPELIWESQYFYVALFSSFANLLVLGWIFETHENFRNFINKIFNFGIPLQCILSFYGMIYFAVLAIAYQSSIFGFFAAVCLSGVFSFSLYYSPGILFLDFKENMLNTVVFGHLIVLGGYLSVFRQFPEYSQYFNAGIQYYCTIALCVGLLVGASPFYNIQKSLGFVVMFIALFFAATYGYFFYDVKVVASIIFSFFILFVLEWIGYIGYKSGMIIGATLVGGSLYSISLLLEKYGSMIILHLK